MVRKGSELFVICIVLEVYDLTLIQLGSTLPEYIGQRDLNLMQTMGLIN
jgi:hypothetical protein